MTSTLLPDNFSKSCAGCNVTEIPIPDGYPREVVIPLAIFLVIVMILTVVGNGMVILTIIRHKRMRTRTNMFITNLAVSDILTAVIDMPVSLVTLIEGRWVFPEEMCQFNGFTMVLFLITSIHTLMYISIHKCISITRPFSRFMTPRRILYMIMAAWLWSLGYATGALLGWNKSVYKVGATQCGPSYPSDAITKSHSLVNTLFNFLLPLTILSVCYFCTFREIRAHMDRMRETSNVDIGDSKTTAIQQKRIAVTLFMVMTCFVLCLTPYVIYSCIGAFSKDKSKVPVVLNPIAYWCIYANCACNPIIYAFRSPAFRQGYKEIMCGRAMHFLSGGSFRSTSQRSWSYRSSVKSTSASKDIASRSSQRERLRHSPSYIDKNVKYVNSNGMTQIQLTLENNHPERTSPDVIRVETQESIIPPLESPNIDAIIPIQQINAPLAERFSPKSDEVEENRGTFYDSDVEMEHELQNRRRRVRRRRQSRSMCAHRGINNGTVPQLIRAQNLLMNIQNLTPPPLIKRPRSLSDLDCEGDAMSSSTTSLFNRLGVPRNDVSKSAGNLTTESPIMRRLGSPLRLFRKSKEKSLEKMKANSKSDLQDD